MARMLTLSLIAVGILLTFNLILGIEVLGFSQASNLFNLANGTITGSEFFLNLFNLTNGILLLGLGASIIAGFYARAQLENIMVLPFITGILIGLVSSLQGLNTYSQSFGGSFAWVGLFMQIFVGLFTVAYVFTCVEFFRGNI